jgi:molybdopterin converting factor small subunit
MTRVIILVGTKKGAFLLHGDAARRDFRLAGPYCEAWPINHVVADPRTGALFAGGGNEWFGPAVWRSTDLGERWTHSSAGLAYAAGETPIKTVWSLAVRDGAVFAGVEPAGLFESRDGGESFAMLPGLAAHPTRPQWQMSGAGGMMLHHIVPHPTEANRIWVGISAAGVFESADGGQSFAPRNRGTRNDYMPDKYPEVGQCVHSLVLAPGTSQRLYQQNHCGMYRSEDGGRDWTSIEAGLPSSFGFPAAAHPRDPDTLYLVPLNGDQLGRYVAGAARRAAAGWCVLRRAAPGDGDRCARPGGRLFRHQQRQPVCQRRRGRELARDRHAPADHHLGGNPGAARLMPRVVLPPAFATLFPGAPREVDVAAASVAEAMAALDALFPGMHDRLVDSRPAIRRHINVFVQGERATLATPLAPDEEVVVMTAISGG